MSAASVETLTPAEAAVVAGVAVRDVNRVIDEKILPPRFYKTGRDRSRRLNADACAFISFYFGAAGQLTSEERLRTIVRASAGLRGEAGGPPEKTWIIRNQFLTIDLAPFFKAVRQRLERLRAARALVVEDPEILGGIPVIRGTRVPVYDVAASMVAGMTPRQVAAEYPGLRPEVIELAALYAEANPLRGRPRRSRSLFDGAVLISSRRVARRARSQETPHA